jgi:decaprenylphospho-beta-D-erythro-pentofuranosid-2-ulose 2-reductase
MSTVLILGATSDIGAAIAREFARAGHNIQLTARNPGDIGRLSADLSIRFNIHASVHAFDAGAIDDHLSFFRDLAPKPDITVYIIGYMGAEKESLQSWAETEKIINANYTGAVSILNIVAGYYASQKKGTIVGISSVAGERGRQSNFLYGSAKAGFTAYLSGLRNYLFPFGAHVVTVKPGFVYTKMTEDLPLPAKLTATPDRVAAAVHKAVEKKKNTVYVKPVWRWIMLVIRSIPEPLFKKMKL